MGYSKKNNRTRIILIILIPHNSLAINKCLKIAFRGFDLIGQYHKFGIFNGSIVSI